MKFENTDVWGFKHAFRGMRNPLNSWNKSDSYFELNDLKGEVVENIAEYLLYKEFPEASEFTQETGLSF